MVLYEIDLNVILVDGMQDKTSSEMVAAYLILVARLEEKVFEPKLHILDNAISREIKQAIKDNDMEYQLVPPHDHRQNVAENAIQVFKDRFVVVVCGADNEFPM
jgi:hypothetical protein